MQFRRLVLLAGVFYLAGDLAQAQQTNAQAPPQSSGVIRAETRLVLVDTVVMDKKGNYVHDLTGKDFLKRFGIADKSAAAYALTAEDFSALAKAYGRIGGLDRLATVIKRVRAERGDKVLFLDGGDTWQGSLGANASRGQDMVDCMALLKPDAMTGHWEFTLGEARVQELIKSIGFPFLALNVRDTEWNEPVFEAMKMFERGGARRSEERRVGKECNGQCRSRWSPYH